MMLKQPPQSPLQAALRYYEYGWSVIPFLPRSKRPMVRWRRFQAVRASRETLEKWFTKEPDANVGIITGQISKLVVLDVDLKYGGDDSLLECEGKHGALPDTTEALSGGGGRHLYFRHPGGSVHNQVNLFPGIDVRGDGGVIIAPPSVHPSGRPYAWEVSHHPDDVKPAAMPAWLRKAIIETHAFSGHTTEHWCSLIADGVNEGARNQSIASLAGHLLWHRVDPEVTRELLRAWNEARCRPPLDDAEVETVVQNILRAHQRQQGVDV